MLTALTISTNESILPWLACVNKNLDASPLIISDHPLQIDGCQNRVVERLENESDIEFFNRLKVDVFSYPKKYSISGAILYADPNLYFLKKVNLPQLDINTLFLVESYYKTIGDILTNNPNLGSIDMKNTDLNYSTSLIYFDSNSDLDRLSSTATSYWNSRGGVAKFCILKAIMDIGIKVETMDYSYSSHELTFDTIGYMDYSRWIRTVDDLPLPYKHLETEVYNTSDLPPENKEVKPKRRSRRG